MARLRNLLVLMTVILHLAALLLPATSHAAMNHTSGPHDTAHSQASHDAFPDDGCCETAGSGVQHLSDNHCAICAVSCAGMQATFATTGSLPLALTSAGRLALSDQTLRSAAPAVALRPPRTSS